MFTLSFGKLLLTAAIVLAAWYGWKWVRAREARARELGRREGVAGGAIEDARRCPRCGTFVAPAAGRCGRADCPL